MSKQIEERAYFKWEMAGRPHGQSEKYWLSAKNEIDPPDYPTALKVKPTYCGYKNRPTFTLATAAGDDLIYNPSTCKEFILDYTLPCFDATAATTPKRPSTKKVQIIVGDWESNIQRSLDLLHQFEDALQMEHSRAYKLPQGNGLVYGSAGPNGLKPRGHLFVGHKRWLISPPMLSLYGLLIRTAYKHKLGDHFMVTLERIWSQNAGPSSYSDEGIWQGGKSFVLKLLKHGEEKIFGSDSKKNWRNVGGGIHGFGVQSYGNESLKHYFPEWYKKLD